ncbi:MAG: class I SAM-dependent methyltransferase [Myxococcota bacterium]
MPLDAYRRANLAQWNEAVPVHVAADAYDVAGFLAGRTTLHPREIAELGDVRGKTLLHLQCHFGMDTLSWARRGARVTGLDFSEPALEAARQLAAEAGLDARFVHSELYDAPCVVAETFDIVYTGIGALNWLPDIRGWARVAADFVEPGGVLYIHEFHPILATLDDERTDAQLVIARPYFEQPEPLRWDDPRDYADPEARLGNTITYEWNHGLGEVATSLIDAGLAIELLHEHATCASQVLPALVHREDGWWELPEGTERLPLMYSIRARRPSS